MHVRELNRVLANIVVVFSSDSDYRIDTKGIVLHSYVCFEACTG
jgi:hypothetical protein